MAVERILMFHMAVTDMAKAKAFYAEKLGFKVTNDYGHGDQHWVSLDAPGGGASLNLTTMHENMKPGTMKLYLSTPDIEAAYQELKAKGVKVNEVKDDLYGPGSGVKWFGITDPDGNKWLIVQS
jgi:predicted enzyme related to lactoylglutathione lyase